MDAVTFGNQGLNFGYKGDKCNLSDLSQAQQVIAGTSSGL